MNSTLDVSAGQARNQAGEATNQAGRDILINPLADYGDFVTRIRLSNTHLALHLFEILLLAMILSAAVSFKELLIKHEENVGNVNSHTEMVVNGAVAAQNVYWQEQMRQVCR